MPTVDEPLNARSVVLSTLLGTDPPRLPVSRILRITQLFGLPDGTVRTALTRMGRSGDVSRDGEGWYALSPRLVARQARQGESRAGAVVEWNGRWRTAVVNDAPRSAVERAALRAAMSQLRLAELREGVWLRPDNLDPDRLPDARAVVDTQCSWWSGNPDDDEAALAARLWDLTGWQARGSQLRRDVRRLTPGLEAGDAEGLRPGFVLSAAVLRHFQADPLLPPELLPRRWEGDALRRDYDRFDAAYRVLLADWTTGAGERMTG